MKTFFLFKKLLKNINLNECSILKINKNNILKLIINTLKNISKLKLKKKENFLI